MNKKLVIYKKLIFAGIILLFIGIFLFLRFYKIDSSLFFQNDIGRDFLVLYNWKISGKPPLLGPQNSALPFNQSAVYFYLFYPAFLITNMSPFSSLYINAVIYIFCFVLALFIAKTKNLKLITLISFVLIIFHPLIIGQNRYVWNPSLVPPFLLLSTIGFLSLLQKWSRSILIIAAFSLAAAVSMSFSVAPVVLAFFLVSLLVFKRKGVYFILYSILSLVILNIPTILFEFKHDFLLTKALLGGNFPSQARLGIMEKISDLLRFIFEGPSFNINLILGGIFIAAILSLIWMFKLRVSRKKDLVNFDKIQGTALILFLLSLIFTLISPFGIQSHYIFGILILGFVLIAALPLRFALIVSAIYLIIWLQPNIIQSYFTPAPRTIAQLESCFVNVCKQEKDPLFVSVQAGFHPYHTGPEFRYLMEKDGCDVKAIEEDPNAAQKMAVVVDQSTFELGKTKYLELSEFNPIKEINKYSCQGDIQVHILQK
ncbi:MAG: hypothetical protein M1142_00255 [Patescibacteria group bacterium]|nr:hypothetical protein [Patescibacteria group bacterium]